MDLFREGESLTMLEPDWSTSRSASQAFCVGMASEFRHIPPSNRQQIGIDTFLLFTINSVPT